MQNYSGLQEKPVDGLLLSLIHIYSTLAPFLFGRGDTAMLFPCGMNLLDNDQNIIEQLILIGEQPVSYTHLFILSSFI